MLDTDNDVMQHSDHYKHCTGDYVSRDAKYGEPGFSFPPAVQDLLVVKVNKSTIVCPRRETQAEPPSTFDDEGIAPDVFRRVPNCLRPAVESPHDGFKLRLHCFLTATAHAFRSIRLRYFHERTT